MTVATSTTDEDEIVAQLKTIIEGIVLNDDDTPALVPSNDSMLDFGNAETHQSGSFTVGLAAEDTGALGGSWGAQIWRVRITITVIRAVQGAHNKEARRRMLRMQMAIRDTINRSRELGRLLLNWAMSGMPDPVKEGDDYYRVTVTGTATYHLSVLGRDC